jgi:hypothetical protein
VAIESSAVSEYLRLIGAVELDRSKSQVIDDLESPDASKFYPIENAKLEAKRGPGGTP